MDRTNLAPSVIRLAAISSLLCVSLFFPNTAVSDATGQWRVSPGKGVGVLELGSKPSREHLSKLGRMTNPGVFPRSGVRIAVLPTDKTIDLIDLRPPFTGKTLKDIRIGSPLSSVVDAYGDEVKVIKDLDGDKMIYNSAGIGFVFKNNLVARMGVFLWQPIGQQTSAMAAVTKDAIVMPGTGMKNLLIGIHKASHVIRAFGGTSAIERSNLPYLKNTGSVFVYPERGIQVVTGGEERTIQAMVFMAPFAGKTQQGVGIGSTVSDVQGAYGPRSLNYIRIRFPGRGIDFMFNQDRVMAMVVYANVSVG